MSWLRTSPLRQSFTRTSRRQSIDATNTECDPKACYDSFCKHWQQIYDIILRAEVRYLKLYTSEKFPSDINDLCFYLICRLHVERVMTMFLV